MAASDKEVEAVIDISKPRYKWWSYMKAVIRNYPTLCEKLSDIQSTSVTASLSGMPRSGRLKREAEEAALRQLPQVEQKEYDAVKRAIEATERYKNGRERLYIIDLVFWKRTHTLEGAALMVPCSYKTARAWHGEFIRMVASCYGLME